MQAGRFTGEVELLCASGGRVAVQWAATAEIVTGRYLALVVALSTSRWGTRFRRTMPPASAPGALSGREREVVRLIAEMLFPHEAHTRTTARTLQSGGSC